MAVAVVVGTEVGPIYYCGGLRGGGKKIGSSYTPLLVTVLVCVGV